MSKRIIPKIGSYNKIDGLSFMRMKIRDNFLWAKRACVLIYNQQDKKEKRNHLSCGHNGCGFGRNDSPKLTKIACRIIQNRETLEDNEATKSLMQKYAAQVICLSNKKKLEYHMDLYYKPKKVNSIPF